MFIEMETRSACSQPDVVGVLVWGSEIRREDLDEALMKGKGVAVHGELLEAGCV